jgi:hypothetical protein
MPVLSRSATIDAPAERVFAYVDDIRNLARHMSERGSMLMMGSKLRLEIVTPEPTGVGATYRYSGRVLGLIIDFSETVSRYALGREKAWRTIGEPRLLIIDNYEMRVLVEPLPDARSELTITIDYTLSPSLLWRTIGGMLAASYAKWCLDSMVGGTLRDLQRTAS